MANRLWGFISKYNPSILSAAVKNNQDPNCKPGKLRWISGNLKLNNSARINLVNRVQKQDYTMIGHSGNREQAVLIDDYPKNIKEWTAKGWHWYTTYECFEHYSSIEEDWILINSGVNITKTNFYKKEKIIWQYGEIQTLSKLDLNSSQMDSEIIPESL